jgi:xanthine dehydrogenase YagR molybdenum-binding subunit
MTKPPIEDKLLAEAAAPTKKTVQMPIGVPGYTLTEESRDVPVTEPPVWPINKDLKYVGQSIERYDGQAKVTGRARYTSDVQLPGMLYAKFVNASVPHAKIVSIDTSAAEKCPGVRGVHVIQHVLGNAVLRDPALDPVKYPVVRYAGQPVAAVAATTPAIAEEAAALVKVRYDASPFVVDLDKARAPDAPNVFPGAADEEASAGGGGGPSNVQQTGNIHGPSIHRRGETDQGFKDADVIVEGHYVTQVQTHSALETHGVVADWKPELLTVWASTQGTASVREELAGFFKIPLTQVRVITEFMGGGFGAKFGAGNPGVVAAALSKKTGAPVRLMLDREEEHLSVGNRPSSDQTLRIGAKKDGTITAIHLIAYGTAGCGTGAGCSGPAANLYKSASLHTEENDVFINAGPASAMRAPGHPQGAFALEQTMDELAVKLGMDPIDLRDKTDEHPVRRVRAPGGARSDLWKSRNPVAGADQGPVKRGVGLAQSVWYRFVSMNSSAEVRIHKDGSLEVLSGVQDIGSGIKTVMAQILAEQFGVPPSQIAVKVGDTNYAEGPNSGGSVTTLSLTPAVRDAAWQAAQKFLADIAPALGSTSDDLVLVDGEVRSQLRQVRTGQLSACGGQNDHVANRGPGQAHTRLRPGEIPHLWRRRCCRGRGRYGARTHPRPPRALGSRLRPPHESDASHQPDQWRHHSGDFLHAAGESPARPGLRTHGQPDLDSTRSPARARSPRSMCGSPRLTSDRVPPTLPASAKPPGLFPSARPSATLSTTPPGCASDELP